MKTNESWAVIKEKALGYWIAPPGSYGRVIGKECNTLGNIKFVRVRFEFLSGDSFGNHHFPNVKDKLWDFKIGVDDILFCESEEEAKRHSARILL